MPQLLLAFEADMRRRLRTLLPAFAILACSSTLAVPGEEAPLAPPLPRETSRWVGKPVSFDELRGRVTLVFVWTFG